LKAPEKDKQSSYNLEKDEISSHLKTTHQKEGSDLVKQLESVNIGSEHQEANFSSQCELQRSTQNPRFEPPRRTQQMEELESCVDEYQFPFLILPPVSSTSEQCQDINGQVVQPSKQQKVIRSEQLLMVDLLFIDDRSTINSWHFLFLKIRYEKGMNRF